MVNNLSNRDLSTFSLDDIKRFLKQEDWEIKYQTSKAIIYAGPILDSGNKLIYRLPADEQNVDYFERVSDLVKIISALKKVSLQKIINEISYVGK